MTPHPPTLDAEKQHLANLLEAIQRCVYFLDAAVAKTDWPLQDPFLAQHKQDVALFGALSAINERFSKLQDVLGAAMRHAALLSGEAAHSFLKVLAFYEKQGVIESVTGWQLYRTVRNMAAHDYEINYVEIATHFNALHGLITPLYRDASRFLDYCQEVLDIHPTDATFSAAFHTITSQAMQENPAKQHT